eukprot:2610499-Pyramimonas_sp.AAC.1
MNKGSASTSGGYLRLRTSAQGPPAHLIRKLPRFGQPRGFPFCSALKDRFCSRVSRGFGMPRYDKP